ncbi:SAM-dependent chlorinase/fluorinase [Candidatus Woesearchaeota archaeon]|nr:SAM-dependent chlorinase/fluorinase [Candidatus Woesearchaeota archaeon]
MKRPFISILTDFGVQTQGIGNMHGVAFSINPEAKVIDLMHGIADFDIVTGARTLETVYFLPVGCHVAVVDPGVGTPRRGIMIQTSRGDYLIGPDNGILLPAARVLGGCKKVVQISNQKLMHQPVSPIFHGRDVFMPAAAHLSKGTPMEEFGPELSFHDLAKAPYEEAECRNGKILAEVIHVNKFGSLHFNIRHEVWDQMGLQKHQQVLMGSDGGSIKFPFVETFGEVPKGKPLIMKDDYLRIEAAINMGNFSTNYGVGQGAKVTFTGV